MASLFRRKKKDGSHVWYVTGYVNGQHFMQSTKTGDKKLAMEVLRKIEEDNVRIEQGMKPAEKVTHIMLSDFINIYLDERKKQGKASNTIAIDLYSLQRLFDFTGNCSMTSITAETVRKYRDLKVKSVKPAGASIELRSLRAAFNWALDKTGIKYLHQNPFKQKGLIPQIEGRSTPMCFSPEEKSKFFAAIKETTHKQLFQFILLTGCRRGEAINLEWADIDLEQKQLTFHKTKTKKDRTIPINLELMQIILVLDWNQTKPFGYDPGWVTHLFKRYLKEAGIEKELHLHSLRHTAASDLVRQGVHLTKIQKFLGHSSVRVTEIYTHVLPEDLREVAEALSCTA